MTRFFLLFVLAAGLLPVPGTAQLKLADIFSDSMVLQQAAPVPVFGRARPGSRITVRFAGATRATVAQPDSTWQVILPPMEASAHPREMTVRGETLLRLRGLLVGEVWLCTGQSNMQLILASTTAGDSVIASANHPLLRLYNASREVAFGHRPGPLGTWQACTPASVRAFSAAAYYFGDALQKKLGVPVGIINASYGGSQAEAWIPVAYLHTPDLQPCIDREKKWAAERPHVREAYRQTLVRWRQYADSVKALGKTPREAPHPPDALREYRIAGSIFRGMIAPLMPFRVKGIFWYQGESNEDRAEQYGMLLPTLIRAWRDGWKDPVLPFGIVQLPNYRDHDAQPADEAWSHLRETQRVTADTVPHTGLIVTIDIGEAHNIHYHDKLDLGKRMTRWALATEYGGPLPAGGPAYLRSRIEGDHIVVTFSETGAGLSTRDGKAPAEFAVAGSDRVWHWAAAKIASDSTVVVSTPDVPHPVAVRYAFNNNPRDPNLTNQSGLPAGPFRSDDWPGPTHGKR